METPVKPDTDRPLLPRAALRIIRDEHRALAAVLKVLQHLLTEQRLSQAPPDFALLRTLLFYLDEFPEQRHHRLESELLFPKLRARSPLQRELLDHLDQDHASGERRIRHLEHLLLAYEVVGEARRDAFEQAVRAYAQFYLAHMAEEERQILPLAAQALTDEDWDELDEAFGAHPDPLAGCTPAQDTGALFRRMVDLGAASA